MIGTGYPLFQLAKALTATAAEADPATRARVRERVAGYYLSEAGLGELSEMLQSGRYDVNVPEEGALLTVAWLLRCGDGDAARVLVDVLAPWFAKLRFYPLPRAHARAAGERAFLESVGEVIVRLKRIKPNEHILAQRQAVCVWTPLYDRLMQLFLETVEGDAPYLAGDAQRPRGHSESGRFSVMGGWPCQHYDAQWATRGRALLAEIDGARAKHPHVARSARPFAELTEHLRRCLADTRALGGRDVGRSRLILAGYVTKRGPPEGARCRALRARELGHASAPARTEIAAVLVRRLEEEPRDDGREDVDALVQPISAAEARQAGIPAGTPISPPLRAKVARCHSGIPATLVEEGLITSAETLARLLPQLSLGVGAGLADPVLQRLFSTLYAAFRRRRSLLLLDLQKQVQLEELPWVAAIERWRSRDLSTEAEARLSLRDVTLLAIAAFPQAILPNKLLQELGALAKVATLDLPLVEEVAADIFMGEFSNKYLEAAKHAAALLENTLYATYYGIDYVEIRDMPGVDALERRAHSSLSPSAFAALCAARAGGRAGGREPPRLETGGQRHDHRARADPDNAQSRGLVRRIGSHRYSA
jgi:hypothetical protein